MKKFEKLFGSWFVWRKRISASLASIVVFVTVYSLVLPAITLDQDTANQDEGIGEEVFDDYGEDDFRPEDPEPGDIETDAIEEGALETSLWPVTLEWPDVRTREALKKAAETAAEIEKIDYTVTASFDEEAELPADVTFQAVEIAKDEDQYGDYYEWALDAVRKEVGEEAQISYARFFDIAFLDGGYEVEPEDSVSIVIEYDDEKELKAEESEDISIVHFDWEDPENPVFMENVEITETDGHVESICFESGTFSVYGVVKTSVGEMAEETAEEGEQNSFSHSLMGGESIMLSELLETACPDHEELQIGNVIDVAAGDTVSESKASGNEDFLQISYDVETGDYEITASPEQGSIEGKEGAVTVLYGDESAAVFEIDVAGVAEVDAGLAKISTADGIYLPDSAEGSVEELAAEDISPSAESVADTGGNETVSRVFDISLNLTPEEQAAYEGGFQVSLTLPEEVTGRDFRLYHIHDGITEELDIVKTGSSPDENGLQTVSGIQFVTESFSEFILQYTVDFHYEVNGKMYEFSIPGGGFASFYKIVEVLGISNLGTQSGSGDENETKNGEIGAGNSENTADSDVYNGVEETGVDDNGANGSNYEESIRLNNVEVSEATRKFVADVASVEFSNPELVWVGKVDEATTVGGLKEANGLEVQYSAELTEEQIAEINNSTVEGGDWALISILPFTSEESLTVTMKNGDQFVVKVTDAQKPYKDVESLENGTYIIYNSFDSSKQAVFMKNDGTSYFTNSTTGVALNAADLSDYTWNVTKNSDGTFTIKSTKNNIYVNLWGNNHNNKDQFASGTSARVTLATESSGISISYGNKMLQRRTSGSNAGFYVHSSTYGKTPLTFYKIENNPSGGTSGEHGIELTDDERSEFEKWKETLETFNTLTDYDKTAEVYNADNRIYKIDITADSGITDFYENVDLGFVLDVSNSMKFPSSLKALEDTNGDEQQVWMTADWLNWAKWAYSDYYDQDGCFYILSDPALTSTIYKVFLDGSQWKYQDASENPGVKVLDINDGTVFKEPFRQAYTLYYADDKTKRMTYLQNSVTYAINTLKKIVTPTDVVDDQTATVQVAYNYFAGISSTNGDSYAIRGSRNFVNLRSTSASSFTVSPAGNEASGTRQDLALYDTNNDPNLAANEFSWHSGYDQYLILVTDGAPNGATMQDVVTAARNLKTQHPNVKLFTIGLSTKDVDGGSQMLKSIADDVDGDGVPEFYEAEKAHDLEYILLRILQTIMAKGIVKGTVTDTIDRAFYPVDSQGNPLMQGKLYDQNGNEIGDLSTYIDGNGTPIDLKQYGWVYNNGWEWGVIADNNPVTNGTPCYAWTHNADDTWTINWYNQAIGWDDNDLSTGNPWTGTVYVKAKEDYLGGNLVATNDGNAQIEPTGIKLVIDGTPETNWRPLEGMTPIDLPVPRVNVHNLESTGNSTTWTVYKDTTVTPAEQIRVLWNNIPIEEVVSATDEGNHKVTTGASANVGTSGTGETFKLADLLTDLGSTFNIDTLIDSLGSGAGASVSSDPILYNAYGHESGTITVTLKREAGTAALTQHSADTVGTPAEKYSLTVTYQPYSESVREGKILSNQESGYTDNTNHHNGSAGRGTEETGTITSNNTHTINVFQKGIKVTKVDKTNMDTVLPGAVFELFRVDSTGTADVSAYNLPSGNYSKVGSDLTADANGIITLNPAIPDKDTAVTDKTFYEPNISVGETENISHDTVFYLVEKTPPTKNGVTYSKMPGAIKFTMTLTENKGTDNTATLYDWTQTAVIAAEEYGNGTVFYLAADTANSTTETNSDIYAFTLKNGRPTDITLIKVDKVTQNSIGGAKFSLLRGSENVDLTDSALTITAINSGAAVTPEDYDFNGATIKVVTVPEGGIKIAGLVDGTYTLREVTAPAGYIITDSGKTFKTENGAIKNTDDTAHTNEATDITFEVENEPGAALPNTGGPGTTIFYMIGLLLTSFAGTGILMKRRRRNAA